MNLGTRSVLVTGAAGWLGRRLVGTLAHGLADTPSLMEPQQGLVIRGLILPGQDGAALKALGERVEVVEGDLRNAADCSRFCEGAQGAVLFHCAGVIHPRRADDFYQVNVEGTRHMLEAAAAAGVRRAVVVSSNSPCGCNPSREHLFDEQSPYHPHMNYGRSKMLMEMVVRELRESRPLESVIVRAPWFYGPDQPSRQTQFYQMIRQGKAPRVGDGENLRSMAYVDNLCQGLMLAALEARADRQIYWIADRRPYTMNEILDTVERLLEAEFGRRCAHRRLQLPSIASDIAQALDAVLQAAGGYHPKLHVLSELNKTIACTVGKAEAELGYRPAIALEEGMRRSLSWCIENGQL